MRTRLAIVSLLTIQTSAFAQTRPAIQEFALDAGHTIIEFSVGFALTHVKGRFTQPRGTILYNAARPESSSVTLIIDAKSIDTGWQHRDEHLRTSDFFDVEKYPTVTFQSERIVKRGNDWTLYGPFTMHGVTKRIAIPFHFLGEPARGAGSSNLSINAAGSLTISRKEFGILGGSQYNSWFNTLRAATVSDSVSISLEVEGWQDASQHPEIDAAVERIRSEGVNVQIAGLRQVKATRPAEFAQYFQGGALIVRALMTDKRTADAVALARALAELYPENASAFLVYGQALAQNGDTKGAAAAYANALSIDPNDTRALEWKRRLTN